MSRAAHAASPAHLPHVTPPVYGYLHSAHTAIHAILPYVNPPAYGYLPAAHAAIDAILPHVTPSAYGYLHSAHAVILAILPHVNPPVYDYLQAPFAPPSSRVPDPSVGQRQVPVRCMEMRGSVETVLHMCIYYNVYHVFSRFFVNKHENITFFSNFFLAKFGDLPGNLYLCTRFR